MRKLLSVHQAHIMTVGHRLGWVHPDKQYPVRFRAVERNLQLSDIGTIEFSPIAMQESFSGHLIRETERANHPFFYLDWLSSKPPAEMVGRIQLPWIKNADFVYDKAPDVPYVVIKGWPRKAGFFRRIGPTTAPAGSNKPYPQIHPASLFKIDAVPAVYAHFGMLIPTITTAIEALLVASDLMTGPLESLKITDLTQVVTAITATSARLWTDYERVEFLGDSVLKYIATINVCAQSPLLPEGLLSRLKDRLVSNSVLFKGAVAAGVDRYIVARGLAIQKWQHVEDLLETNPKEQMEKTRELPTKTPADVIESLIGVAFKQGGVRNALDMIARFIPTPPCMKWESVDIGRQKLFDNALNVPLPVTMRPVEKLIGYTFRKKGLLAEALTHPSYNVPGEYMCFERLEFLGDAVLDYIVVKALYEEQQFKNSEMHTLKTTLVNADILAFLMMELAIEEERVDPVTTFERSVDDSPRESSEEEGTARPVKGLKIDVARSTVRHPIWSFMRHGSAEVGVLQEETRKRHERMREGIWEGLRGERYPWIPLIKLQAAKVYSDLFESLLGAVWVDSGGDIKACTAFIEAVGVMPLMRRLVSEKVHLHHPKEELGWLAGSEKVDYYVEARVVTVDDEPVKDYVCRVEVGGKVVAQVEGAQGREEARWIAAEEAVRFLKQEKKVDGDGDLVME